MTNRNPKYRVAYTYLVLLDCGCCSEYQEDEDFFDTKEAAIDFINDYWGRWCVYECIDGNWSEIKRSE